MNRHTGTISSLWTIAGLWLVVLSLHDQTIDWLLLGLGALAVVAAVAFWRWGLLGRILIRAVSVLTLVYAAAWLLLGGVEDAGNYWPWILFSNFLAIYTLWAANRAGNQTGVVAPPSASI